MDVNVIGKTNFPEIICGIAAATCTRSGDFNGALRGALKSGHESVIEHASITIKIEGVSRVLLAQLTRHRLASFSVESQRYVSGSGMTVVVPESIAANPTMADAYGALNNAANAFYLSCLNNGIDPEDARYGLLMGGTTTVCMTMNFRELKHFLELRCCNRAQWEIRELADHIREKCLEIAPEIFKNSGCACMQGKPCPEGKKSCGHPRKG